MDVQVDVDLDADVKLKGEEVQLSFSNIRYCIPRGRGKSPKQILSNISGYVQSGQILAIMGPTGCGKTTLLNILSGRIRSYSGEVLLNGSPIDDDFSRNVGYISQDDAFLPHLTVREQLMYTAFLRLSHKMPKSDKLAKVVEVEDQLGLTECSGTKIGNILYRGVSGGERKRTNIGVSLICEPKILFVDEPTSGLDSCTAKTIMNTLKELASSGCVIVLSIHQPRSDIFSMFDHLLLLSAGETVYYGPGSQVATKYFTDHQVEFPEIANPADILLDLVVLSKNSKGSGMTKLIEAYLLIKARRGKKLPRLSIPLTVVTYKQDPLADPMNYPPPPPPLYAESSYSRIPVWYQFLVLCNRCVVNNIRDPLFTLLRLTIQPLLGVMFGWVFLHLGSDQIGLKDKSSALFTVLMSCTFPSAMLATAIFILEREVFVRERMAGMYRTSAYYTSKVLTEFPVNVASAVITNTFPYWMMGLNKDTDRFFTFLFVVVLLTCIAAVFGMIVSTFSQDINIANILVSILLILLIIFAGFLRTSDAMPDFWIWMTYLSFYRYGYTVLICNEFSGVKITCPEFGVCPFPTGDSYLKYLGFHCSQKWNCI